ncbi:hypothetical protein FOA52_003316 [Chlamydomonas sp. UWO 241]|nr:hypothetical protein FOA52_003316 [Chlamydomonas sp. UWO 241]
MVPSPYSALATTAVLAARKWCVEAATYKRAVTFAAGVAPTVHTDSYGLTPSFSDAHSGSAAFTAAVAVCANIPEPGLYVPTNVAVVTDWKNWCLKCLWSPTAQPKPAGTLVYSDWKTRTAANMPAPDYGACAFQANQSFSVEAKIIKPVGIRATCAWEKTTVLDEFIPPVVNPGNTIVLATGFAIGKCLDCMDTTYQNTDVPGGAGTQPINTSKAYACALCRHPNWITGTIAITAKDKAQECYNRVTNQKVYNSWDCNYCYEASFVAGLTVTNPDVSTKCMKCVTANLYEDKVGSYNWACAEYASILDEDLQKMCMDSILEPARNTENFITGTNPNSLQLTDLPANLENAEYVGMVTEVIGSRIDMAKVSTWGTGGLAAWYIAACLECSAMEKAQAQQIASLVDVVSLLRRNITWSEIPNHGSVAEDPRVPFVKVASAAYPPANYTLMDCTTTVLAAMTNEQKAYLVSVLAGATCTTQNGLAVSVLSGSIACDSPTTIPVCSLHVPSTTFSGYMLVHLDETIQVNNTGAICVACMRNFTDATYYHANEDFAYACEQYCMNTYTISNRDAFTQLKEASTTMKTRKKCMTCVNNPSLDTNKDWACGECVKLTSTVVSNTCIECIANQWVDPCACVDSVKRGWLFFNEVLPCLHQLDTDGIDDTLKNGNFTGTKSVLSGANQDAQCAEIADKKGHATFGLIADACYTFAANAAFIHSIVPVCASGSDCVCLFVPGADEPITIATHTVLVTLTVTVKKTVAVAIGVSICDQLVATDIFSSCSSSVQSASGRRRLMAAEAYQIIINGTLTARPSGVTVNAMSIKEVTASVKEYLVTQNYEADITVTVPVPAVCEGGCGFARSLLVALPD